MTALPTADSTDGGVGDGVSGVGVSGVSGVGGVGVGVRMYNTLPLRTFLAYGEVSCVCVCVAVWDGVFF